MQYEVRPVAAASWFRHLLPPAIAVLLSIAILLLNEEGISSLADPVVALVVSILAGAVWYLFRPRHSVSAAGQNERLHTGTARKWLLIVPIVALLAGPVTAVLRWALGVYVIEADFYISNYERLETLPTVLFIGSIVGVLSFAVAAIWSVDNWYH